jgi:hypothetical protein
LKDGQGNTVYNLEKELPDTLGTIRQTIVPGQSITGRLEFALPRAGTFYVTGRYFERSAHDIVARYIDTPFLVITAR